MAHAAFVQALWGLLLIFIDIKFDELDIFTPDIVGYVLVYLACTRLTAAHREFKKPQPYILTAAVLWLLETLKFNPLELVSVARTAADAMMIWYLCTGIMRLAIDRDNITLAGTAGEWRKLYVVATMINLGVASIARVAPDLALVFVFPAIAITLLAGARILLLLRRASLQIS